MAKTVANLLVEISERVDDESNRRFSLPFLRRLILEGEREIARRSECLRATASIAVTAGASTVTGPVDAIRLTHAEFAPTGQSQVYPLEYADRRALDPLWGTMQNVDTSNAPFFFTTWGFPPTLTIQFSPIPSGAGTLIVYYYRMPANISDSGTDDTDAIDLPDGWEDLVSTYVEARCYRKDRRLEDYSAAMSTFDQQLNAITMAAQRYSDAPGQITYSPQWPGYADSW